MYDNKYRCDTCNDATCIANSPARDFEDHIAIVFREIGKIQ